MRILVIPFCLLLFSCVKHRNLGHDHYPAQAYVETDELIHTKNSLEWWYFTGWLNDTISGDTYGIEHVFFHFNINGKKDRLLSNMAITDLNGKKFYSDFILSSTDSVMTPGNKVKLRAENKTAESNMTGFAGNYALTASSNKDSHPFSIELKATNIKPAVLHGKGSGFEQYGSLAKAGYYTYPALDTKGKLRISGKEIGVKGELWYDRQWNCAPLLMKPDAGWDWMGATIEETGDQLMVYRVRLKNESSVYGGTIIRKSGKVIHLKSEDINFKEMDYWQSPNSLGIYPLYLAIEIPSYKINLSVKPALENQELEVKILPGLKMHYWEGMCHIEGTQYGKQVNGKAYLEITNPNNL